MKTIIAVLLGAAFLAGCERAPISSEQTNNPNYQMEKLFDAEGCTIFRFYDGRNIYFAKCEHNETMSWYEPHGKTYILRMVVTSNT